MDNSKNTVIETLRHHGDEPHLLREVFRTYQVLMDCFSRKTGMPPSRFALMRLLMLTNENVGIMDLSRQLGVNAAAVTRQVQDMERDGLISRRASTRDGRRNYVRLSPKGRRLFEKVHERTHEIEQSFSSVLAVEEMRSAAMVLTKLRTFVENLR